MRVFRIFLKYITNGLGPKPSETFTDSLYQTVQKFIFSDGFVQTV